MTALSRQGSRRLSRTVPQDGDSLDRAPQARCKRCGYTSRYQSLCSSRMSAMACRIETLSGATSPPEALARVAARTRSIAPYSLPTSPSEVVPRRWARQVIVRVGDVGAMLRIERHLEEVRKTATVAARAARAAGIDCSRMNDVVARDVLRERRYRVVAIHALGHVDVPLRPAVGGPAGAGWLHRGDAVRIPGKARAEPGDHHVTVRVRGDPGKDVGLAGGRSAVHAHRHGPVSSRVGGRREEDALVVRPDDVGVAEVVHC